MTSSERKFRLLYWSRLVIVTVIAVYVGAILFGAAAITIGLTIPLKRSICCQSPRDFGSPYENIRFQTAQGLSLAGWYIPPQNGAVIILLHSYYGDRRQVLPVAGMLARHGYGVLLYDQRASGESEGEVRSLGWLDIPDVNQAVAFVHTQPGTKDSPVGLYGCSVGGAIAMAAAALHPGIDAVAADAPSALSFDDGHPNIGDPGWLVDLPIDALYFQFVALRAGTPPPLTTHQAVTRVTPRPLLLISTGEGAERARVEALYALAGEPRAQRNIPAAGHCQAPLSQPDIYEQYLVDFFDERLLGK